MIVGRDQLRGPSRRRAQAEFELPGPVRGVQPVEQPDVARAVIGDPLAVGAGVAGVAPVMVGVPPQVAAVHRTRVQVARALVVREERQAPADQHGAGELARQARVQPGEPRRRLAFFRPGRAHPQPSRRPAPVPLPPCRVDIARGQQRDPGALDGRVGHRAERQQPAGSRAVAPRCPARLARLGRRQCVSPGEVAEGLARGGDRDDLTLRCPAADLGGVVGPVAEPAAVPAVDPGQVGLGRAVPPAGPGDRRAIPGDPGTAHRRVVGRDPPGPAAAGRGEPDVVLGDEGDDVAVDVREAEVSGCRRHRLIVGPGG
jgi:hypothetical protein